jgi:hypothetical protein
MSATGTRATLSVSIEGDETSVLRASLGLSVAPTRALEFLQNAMEQQNLSLFYRTDGDITKILFVPCYIDDGLHGVKAPTALINL